MPVPELQNNGWIGIPWAEFIGKDGSHGASWNSTYEGESQSTFQILVNWVDGPAAEIYLLGSSRYDDNTGLLFRTMPARHPYKPSQFADKIISAQPLRWDSKAQSFSSAFVGTSAGVPLSQYQWWLLTIGFVTPKYRVLSDSDLQRIYGASQEWRRFCEAHIEYHSTTLSKNGQTWRWAATAAGGPTLNEALSAPFGKSWNGQTVILRWRRLPRRGLYTESGEGLFFNKNLSGCINRVHNGNTDLWGLPGNVYSGVLRFDGAKATPIASPFDPAAQGLTATSINAFIDLELTFSVWDPPFGDTTFVNPNNLPDGMRGHNLAPNPGDNLWYLISTGGNVGGTPSGALIFPTTDLSTVFQLATPG